MNKYKQEIEKKAGFLGKAFKAQQIAGAATGALIGTPLGYEMGRMNGTSSHLEDLRKAKDVREGRASLNLHTDRLNERVMSHAAYDPTLMIDYGDTYDVSHLAKKTLADKNIDINNMKVKDFRALSNKLTFDVFGDDGCADALGVADINDIKAKGDNVLKQYSTPNIEKKAFFSEAGVGALTGIGVGYGAGKVVNGAHNLFTKQGRKDRKEYKQLLKDESLKKTHKLLSSQHEYVRNNFDKILVENPDITMGEMAQRINNSYVKDIRS